jgi:hypothetical protein
MILKIKQMILKQEEIMSYQWHKKYSDGKKKNY